MFRMANWVLICSLLGASTMLYHTSYHVQELEQQIRQIESKQAHEQERLQVLEAEWAYLTTPDRLQKLAREYSELRPIKTSHIITANIVAETVPLRLPKIASAQSEGESTRLDKAVKIVASIDRAAADRR